MNFDFELSRVDCICQMVSVDKYRQSSAIMGSPMLTEVCDDSTMYYDVCWLRRKANSIICLKLKIQAETNKPEPSSTRKSLLIFFFTL